MPSPTDTVRLIKSFFAGNENSFGGEVVFGGTTRFPPVKITGTSVLTSTTLTAAAHSGRLVVFSSGTSLGTLRHRFKLPAAAAGTSGHQYIIGVNIRGTPTSNGVVVRPGTTTDRISGTTKAGGALKGSTRGNRGTSITFVSDGAGNYYIAGKATPTAGASTSLVWKTT